MLIKYEKEILGYFNTVVPEIRSIRYSEDTAELLAESKALEYPSVFYTRQDPEWTTSWQTKAFDIIDRDLSYRALILPLKIKYKADILCASHEQALHIMKEFRFAWVRNPYVWVKYPSDEDRVKVGLKLLYIKVITDNMEVAKSGPLRKVELSWESQLCISNLEELTNVSQYEIRLINNQKELIRIL